MPFRKTASMAPAAPLVRLSLADTVATITIDRPAALNSINPAVVHQLELALAQAVADPDVRGIVLAGAGKAFIVGADIPFFVRNIDAGDIDRIVHFTAAGQRLVTAIDQCPKTVVARISGAAWGAAPKSHWPAITSWQRSRPVSHSPRPRSVSIRVWAARSAAAARWGSGSPNGWFTRARFFRRRTLGWLGWLVK